MLFHHNNVKSGYLYIHSPACLLIVDRPTTYNTNDGGVAISSEVVDSSAAEVTTGDVDRAAVAESEATGEDAFSVEQPPNGAGTTEVVENEKEEQQGASGWHCWNEDFIY